MNDLIDHKQYFNAQTVTNWVNDELLSHRVSERGCAYSVETVRIWLIEHGYKYEPYKKAFFYDGHEAADTVKYRMDWLNKMVLMRRNSYMSPENEIENEIDAHADWRKILERKRMGKLTYIHYWHDECTFHKFEHKKFGWCDPENGLYPFLPKK